MSSRPVIPFAPRKQTQTPTNSHSHTAHSSGFRQLVFAASPPFPAQASHKHIISLPVRCFLFSSHFAIDSSSHIQYSDRAINTDTQPPALIIDRVAILKPPVQRLHPATSSPDYPRRRNQHRGCQRGSGSTKHRRSPQAREPTFLKVKPARPGPTEVASDSDTGFSPSTPPDKISIKKKHGEGGKYPPYPYIFRSKHQYINTSLYPRTYPSQSFTNHQYIYTHHHQHIPLRHITTHLNTTSQHPPRQAHHSSP